VGGVADYTAILSRRLVEVSGGAVEPVLVHAGRTSTDAIEVDYPAVDLSGKCSAATLAETINQLAGDAQGPTVVLLEYSGYGYAKRGAPLWLVRSLQRVCGETELPLITMFHELYATGPPWTSAFWITYIQRYVAMRLAQCSRAVMTNRPLSAKWLRTRVDESTPIRTQSVFSNVGEPESILPFEDRDPYAVVFGGSTMKNRLYKTLECNHAEFLSNLGVNRVIDLGPSNRCPDSVSGVPAVAHGLQPASVISRYLERARVGLLQYPVDHLTKSGIWASYAAHGVAPLVISDVSSSDPLEAGYHFLRLSSDDSLFRIPKLKRIGSQAWDWYQAKAHSRNAAHLFASFAKMPSVT
jgi:hypothetical protein